MEHIRNECKVKKEAAEMKSQNAKHLEKLQYLQKESRENKCKQEQAELQISSLLKKVQQLEQEVAEKDERIKEFEKQVCFLTKHTSAHPQINIGQ